MNVVFAYIDTLLIILLPTILAAAIIFFLYARKLSSIKSTTRSEEMRILAMKIGFDYQRSDEFTLKKRLESDKIFFHGNDGKVENIISGNKSGLDVMLFDYCYSELQQDLITICMITPPQKLSEFKMIPLSDAELATGEVAAELGEKLIGEKYQIECKDEGFAKKALNDNLEDFLSRRRRTTCLVKGDTMVFHRQKFLGIKNCYSLLDFAFGFYAKMGLKGNPQEHTREEKKDTLNIQADIYAD